jgi:hypothetical protein
MEHFRRGVPEEPLRGGVRKNDSAPVVDHEHGVGRRLDRESEPLLGALAFGDVDHRGEDEGSLRGLEGVETNLDGHFRSVLPQAEEVASGPHGPGPGIAEERPPLARMSRPESGRDEHFDGLPQQLRARISEQLLGLGIDQHDFPGFVHQDH